MSSAKRLALTSAAAVVASSLMASSARAQEALPGVLFDLRVHDTGGKAATVTQAGDTIVLDLYMTLQGLDLDPSNDYVQSTIGSFRSSTGGLRGDLLGLPLPAPFNSLANPGLSQDLDGDGDRDVGGTANNVALGWYSARANTPQTSPNGSFLVGQARFTAGAVTDASTALNWLIRPTASGFLGWYDGNYPGIGKNNTAGTLTVNYGAPVTITGSPSGTGTVSYITGTVASHLSVAQTTRATPGAPVTLSGGADVAAGATLDLSDASNGGALHANDLTSGNAGGTLITRTLSVGAGGKFTQNGGFTSVSHDVTISPAGAAVASLDVVAGSLSLGNTTVTGSGARIAQTGGTSTFAALALKGGAAASLTAGATTVAADAVVGEGSVGRLTVDGATLIVNRYLFLGYTPDGYAGIGAGELDVRSGSIFSAQLNVGGQFGTGSVVQTGGAVGGRVSISAPNGSTIESRYLMQGGTLSPSTFLIESSDYRATGPARLIQSGGTIAVGGLTSITGAASSLELNGGSFSTERATVGGASVRQSAGTATWRDTQIKHSSSYTLTGGSLTFAKTLKMEGLLDLSNVATTVTIAPDSFADFSRGTIANASNATFAGGARSLMSFASQAVLDSIGAVTTQGLIHVAGHALVIPANQKVGGSGTIEGDVSNAGVVSPGNSPGQLVVNGNYTQAPGGSMLMEIAGDEAEECDLLSVTGAATLGGSLQVSLLDGYVPAAGDSFRIVSASSLGGTFANAASWIDLPGGRFNVNYSTTGVTLSNFTPVPEPAAAGMLLLAAPALLSRGRRRREAGK